MKTQIYALPEFKGKTFPEQEIELTFFRHIIEILNCAHNVEDAHAKLRKLFIRKLSNRNIGFDYGLTDKGIIVQYEEQDVLFTECDTTDYLNSE